MFKSKTHELLDQLIAEAEKRGNAYAAGYLSSTLKWVVLNYVPIASRQELIEELEESINFLTQDEKNNGVLPI